MTEQKTEKLTKEKKFYYLDYLQKKLIHVVQGEKLSIAALDKMLFMIMELKKEERLNDLEAKP